MCHFGVYRRSLVEAIGGFRPEYDGSQDYDLVLRFTERTDRIVHLPSVLYSWRKIRGSAAHDVMAKPYAVDAAQRAVEDALRRRGVAGRVEPGYSLGQWRVRYDLRGQPPVTLVISAGGNMKCLQACLESVLERSTYSNLHVLVTDDSDGTAVADLCRALGRRDPRLKYRRFRLKPFNYSAINNSAVSLVDTPYVVLLNDDVTVITPDWVEAMLEHAQRPEVGVVGAKLLYPDRSIQHAGVILGPCENCGHAFKHFSENDPGLLRSCSRHPQLQRRHLRVRHDETVCLRRGRRPRRAEPGRGLQRRGHVPSHPRARLLGGLHAVRRPLPPRVGHQDHAFQSRRGGVHAATLGRRDPPRPVLQSQPDSRGGRLLAEFRCPDHRGTARPDRRRPLTRRTTGWRRHSPRPWGRTGRSLRTRPVIVPRPSRRRPRIDLVTKTIDVGRHIQGLVGRWRNRFNDFSARLEQQMSRPSLERDAPVASRDRAGGDVPAAQHREGAGAENPVERRAVGNGEHVATGSPPTMAPSAVGAPDGINGRRPKRNSYAQVRRRIREVVNAELPAGSVVVVVSRGDDNLLNLGSRRGWHFPQTEAGVYAGFYPADSGEAIAHVEQMRRKGADYLLFPSTAFWWLGFYGDFQKHLESRYPCICSDPSCVIFQLSTTPAVTIETGE